MKIRRYSSGFKIEATVAFDREGYLKAIYCSKVPNWSARRAGAEITEKVELRIADAMVSRLAKHLEHRGLSKPQTVAARKAVQQYLESL